MKIKFLTLLAASLFLFSCSTEETNEINNDDVNFTVGNNFNGESGGGSPGGDWFPCEDIPCDPNYVFPTPVFGVSYRNLYITYDESVPLDKIPCVRQEYFECFSLNGLAFPPIQSQNPREELWLVDTGKPGTGLDTTVCNDPRTNSDCED